MIGVSIGQALTGTIPEPIHRIEWHEDMPTDVREGLRAGETAMLYGIDGEPFALVLMDSYGTIRHSYGTIRQKKVEIDP